MELADAGDPAFGGDRRHAQRHERHERVLTRLLAHGGATDPSGLANRLLDECGSLGRVLSTEPLVLAEIAGSDDLGAYLVDVRAAMLVAAREALPQRIRIGSGKRLIEYLRLSMAHLRVEQVRVLYVDARQRLLREEVVAWGAPDGVPLDAAVVMRRALVLGAKGIFVVHNHPSGDLRASRDDIEATRLLCDAGRLIGILVLDHVIVSDQGVASLRAAGYL